MHDVRKTELLEVSQELAIMFDRLGRTRTAINYGMLNHTTEKKEMLEDRASEKNILDAQDRVMGAIYEISKII